MEPGRDYEELYREAAPNLWRALFAYCGGRRDIADDAVSEAFARAIENDGVIRKPVPWLYRTAFRVATVEMRRDSRRASLQDSALEEPEGMSDLTKAMRDLSPGQRAAVYLHYQADLPVREVADLMGTSGAVVRVHLHRGRKRLRELLGTDEDGEG